MRNKGIVILFFAVAALMLVAVILIGSQPVAAEQRLPDSTTQRGAPYLLETEAFTAYFESMTLVGSESEVVEQRIVDEQGHEIIRKIPGRTTYSDIVLTRGLTNNKLLWDWRQMVVNGNVSDSRQNGILTAFADDGTVIAQWHIENVWPRSIVMVNRANDVPMEVMTLVTEGMIRSN